MFTTFLRNSMWGFKTIDLILQFLPSIKKIHFICWKHRIDYTTCCYCCENSHCSLVSYTKMYRSIVKWAIISHDFPIWPSDFDFKLTVQFLFLMWPNLCRGEDDGINILHMRPHSSVSQILRLFTKYNSIVQSYRELSFFRSFLTSF